MCHLLIIQVLFIVIITSPSSSYMTNTTMLTPPPTMNSIAPAVPPVLSHHMITASPTTSRPMEEVFQQAGFELPESLFFNYTPPNYTMGIAVSQIQSMSSWRHTDTVLFTEQYAYSLAYVPIILVILFMIFSVLLIVMACTVCCNETSPMRKSSRQLLQDGCCTITNRGNSNSRYQFTPRGLRNREARAIFATLMILAWIIYLTSFAWSWHMYINESGFETDLESLKQVFVNVNTTANKANVDAQAMALLLSQSNISCPSSPKPAGMSDNQWTHYQNHANACFTYMTSAMSYLTTLLEKGPLQIAPSMIQVIAHVETVAGQIITTRTVLVGVLLAILLVVIPILTCLDLVCTALMVKKDASKQRCMKCQHSLILVIAVIVILLFTIMVGVLFSLLFFTADMCNPDPLIFLARVGGELEGVPQVATVPAPHTNLPQWCQSTMANLTNTLASYYGSEYENTNNNTALLPNAPISTQMFCFYGTCETYGNRPDLKSFKTFLTDEWIPLVATARFMGKLAPNNNCTLYVNELLNNTQVVVEETVLMAASISCAEINPIMTTMFYSEMCNTYIYMESVLTALVLTGNILLSLAVFTAVTYDLSVLSEEERAEAAAAAALDDKDKKSNVEVVRQPVLQSASSSAQPPPSIQVPTWEADLAKV